MKTPTKATITATPQGGGRWLHWRFTCKQHATTAKGIGLDHMAKHLRFGHGMKLPKAILHLEAIRDKALADYGKGLRPFP